MKYLVRTNCEYSILIEADDEDQAMEKAGHIEYKLWQEAWAPFEAEETDE